jgi:hypothetical protein
MKISRRKLLVGLSTVGAGAILGTQLQNILPRLDSKKYPLPNEMMIFHETHFNSILSCFTPAELQFVKDMYLLTEKNGYQVKDDFFYSGFAFSHRVQEELLHSRRFAIGTFTYAEQVPSKIHNILSERGIDLAGAFDGSKLSGLGWDFDENTFKIYSQVEHLSQLKSIAWRDLIQKVNLSEAESFGLASITYSGANASEYKIYTPLNKKGIARAKEQYPFNSEIIHINQMICSRRGLVHQLDLRENNSVTKYLNSQGQKVIEQYAKLGLSLDTIAFQSPAHFTIYFG